MTRTRTPTHRTWTARLAAAAGALLVLLAPAAALAVEANVVLSSVKVPSPTLVNVPLPVMFPA